MASLNFNAAAVEPQAPISVIPAGVYDVMAVDSEVKNTQSGGQMAVFRLVVTAGSHQGRTLWARINIKNPSADAERIGQSQLSAYCRAAGVMQLTDTAQLHNRPVRARVKIRPASDKYPESNEVTGFEAIGGPGTAPAVQVAQPAAAAAPAAVPPWQKARAA